MQNDYPRYPQNFRTRLPLAGYEWYSSRLVKLRLSGFIESIAAAADSMMQLHCQIERDIALPSVYLSTRFTPDVRVIMSDHTEECLDLQTRQSLVASY